MKLVKIGNLDLYLYIYLIASQLSSRTSFPDHAALQNPLATDNSLLISCIFL